MWVPENTASEWSGGEGDRARALAWLAGQTHFFDSGRPVFLSRAPGRLDVMGGIADYSGALVLEMPIAAATWVAAQPSDAPEILIRSDDVAAVGDESTVRLPLRDLVPEQPLTYERARALLAADPRRAWAAYAAGALVVLHAELGKRLRHGLRLLIWSEVPVGKGLSSSAALEVATLEAVAPMVGATLQDRELPLLAQKVENFVVGAPCGVMDQMASALGRGDHLLELVCQPAEVMGQLPVPHDLEFVGMDSGIRHAVSGADYGTVRAATFMGYRMLAAAAGLAARPLSPGRVVVEDAKWGGYLANVSVDDWRNRYRADIPEQVQGSDFLARFQGTTDAATTVEPARIYPVRAATGHAIEEHQRVVQFRALLAGKRHVDEQTRIHLGELMYASHASYSACGLGASGTDQLVALVRELGPRHGFYGAKITGGGSGGTVAVLVERVQRDHLAQIVDRYARATGHQSAIYAGSSDGGRSFGVVSLKWSSEASSEQQSRT
jgi:galactokinase